MSQRSLLSVAALILLSPRAEAVTITFETRPDGTPIQDIGGPNCGEITFETFRPWGVLFTPSAGDVLNIGTTLECLSLANGLWPCSGNGAINVTFVIPGTDTSTVVDGIEIALFTATYLPWQGRVNTYDAQGILLDGWALTSAGFCREPPAFYDFYHFRLSGRIARVECILRYVGIDDVVVTEATTPVDGSTWGLIKSVFQ